MDKDFEVFDFHRIFVGDLPLLFLLEIVFRTIIMYSYTIVLLRLLGKRGMGQLSTLELAIIICFGTAVGDPMIHQEVPILHGIVAITVIALFQVYMERFINRNKKLEAIMEGEPRLMVDDGIIKWECMLNENLSKEDLFRFLRNKEVEHLGQVHKALFEISGQVSVMFHPPRKVKPGLSVLPENNIPASAILHTNDAVPATNNYSCYNCGNSKLLRQGSILHTCELCDSNEWIRSVE